MDDLLALDGGSSATQWQRRHAKRKAREAKLKARRQMRAEAKADLKKRTKKWRVKKAAAKAAGLPFVNHTRPRDMSRPQWDDLTGRKFGRLTVIRIAPVSKNGKNHGRRWWCRCDCGSGERLVAATILKQGNSRSCGCLLRERVRENWRSGKLAAMVAQRRALAASPLSIQLAELRRRIASKQKTTGRDAKLLSMARLAIMEHEVTLGIRRREPSGKCSLVGRAPASRVLH